MQVGAVRLEPSAPLEDHVAAAARPTSPSSRAAGARRRCAGGSRSRSGCDGRRRRAGRRARTARARTVAEQAKPFARRHGRRGPSARPDRRARAAPRSSLPTRRRRGAVPAREVPVDERDRRAVAEDHVRREEVVVADDVIAAGALGGGWSGSLAPVGRRLEAGLGVVHPPEQRAERVQGLVIAAAAARAPARPRRT